MLEYAMTFFFAFMLAGNMAFFYTFQKYEENLESVHRQQIELASQRAEIERLRQTSELREDFRETLHNAEHYMRVIGEWARENRVQEIAELVDEMSGKLSLGESGEYCQNKMLDMILHDYEERVRRHGVAFDAYVEPGSVLDIRDDDMMVMFGNLLDNALTASVQEQGDASVSVRVFMQGNGKICVAKVTNSFTGRMTENGGRLASTKRDGGIHGAGIPSVSRAAEKYGGYLEHYADGEQFVAVLVLPVPEEKMQ